VIHIVAFVMRRPSLFVPLIERNFRLYLSGQALVSTGVWMQKLAQAWLILELTDSGLALGLTVACQQLPTLLFAGTAGALADRFDKRKVVLSTTAYGCLPPLVVGIAQHAHIVTAWLVVVAAFAQGCADVLDRPTRMTLVHELVPAGTLAKAVSLGNIAQETGKLIGPAIGGVLIALIGLPNVFLINSGLYVLVFAVMLSVRLPQRVRAKVATRLRGNLLGTIRYVASRPTLAAGLGLMGVSGLFAYNYNVLVTLLVRDVLDGSAAQAGLAFTCLGLGGILGGLVLAGTITMNSRSQVAVACWFAGMFTGVAFAPGLVTAYALLFLVGALSVTFRSTSSSVLQLNSDPEMRGRVASLYYLALVGTSPIGGPLQGWISQLYSARAGFVLGGLSTVVAAVVVRRYLKARKSWARSETG
jgi:MFS family permease